MARKREAPKSAPSSNGEAAEAKKSARKRSKSKAIEEEEDFVLQISDADEETPVESNEEQIELPEEVNLARKPKRLETEEQSFFTGEPVDVDKAKRRWPHRYLTETEGEEAPTDTSMVKKCQAHRHYTKAKVDGRINFTLGDDAHVLAGDGEDNYICRIVEMFEGVDGEPYITAQWFYRAKDTVIKDCSNLIDDKRVFLSNIKGDNHLDCLLAKIKIVQLSLNELPQFPLPTHSVVRGHAPVEFETISLKLFCGIMEIEEIRPKSELNNISQMFHGFMTRVTKFAELVDVGCRLLVGFQQALVFLRKPSIAKASKLVESIINANATRRISSYVEAGCVNTHDRVQNMNKLHTYQVGLLKHVKEAKEVVDELEGLIEDVIVELGTSTEDLAHLHHEDPIHVLDPPGSTSDKEITLSSDPQKPEITDYATMMAVIYSMVKQDYFMQEKIVSALNLNSTSEELENYSLMWSLRPYIDDEVMHQAWRLIH